MSQRFDLYIIYVTYRAQKSKKEVMKAKRLYILIYKGIALKIDKILISSFEIIAQPLIPIRYFFFLQSTVLNRKGTEDLIRYRQAGPYKKYIKYFFEDFFSEFNIGNATNFKIRYITTLAKKYLQLCIGIYAFK